MHNSTRKKTKEFLELLKKNSGNIRKTCEEYGIPRQYFYSWMKDAEFSQSVKDIEDDVFDMVEEKLIELIKKGEYRAIEFYLKTKGKNKGYATNNEVEVAGGAVTKIIIKPYEKK